MSFLWTFFAWIIVDATHHYCCNTWAWQAYFSPYWVSPRRLWVKLISQALYRIVIGRLSKTQSITIRSITIRYATLQHCYSEKTQEAQKKCILDPTLNNHNFFVREPILIIFGALISYARDLFISDHFQHIRKNEAYLSARSISFLEIQNSRFREVTLPIFERSRDRQKTPKK